MKLFVVLNMDIKINELLIYHAQALICDNIHIKLHYFLISFNEPLISTLGKTMKAPLYDEILYICQHIANASAQGNDEARDEACKNLQKLCATSQGTPKDHPLQWEALGDFTEDGELAMDIYEIALASAEKLKLPTFTASVYLAMAQRQHEFEETEKAIAFAKNAETASESIDSEELKQEIKAFLATL
jgi:hypothetical protein